MSAGTPSSARDGHLDDDAALDALDGVLDPAAAGHLSQCARCRAELAALDAVRAAVAAPVPHVDDAARDAAIAAALAAHPEGRDRSSAAPQAAAAAPSVDLDARRAERWAGSAALRWMGAAAAVVLLALAVPLLASTGGDDDEADTAAGGAAEESATGPSDDEATALAVPFAPVPLGDLGALEPDEDLAPALDRALGDPPQAAGDQPDGAGDGDAGATGEPVPGASGSGGEDADAPAREQEEAEADTAGVSAPCEAVVRTERPELGALAAIGTATVGGAPAVVLAFDRPAGPDPALTVVVAQVDACQVLGTTTYPRP